MGFSSLKDRRMCNEKVPRYTTSSEALCSAPMENPPIERLLEEAELCRRLAPRVRLYGLKHLRDDQAAADLMQEVLMMTIEKLRAGELREADRVISFVFGSCRMIALDLRRGRARRERLLQQYGDDLPIADASVAPRLDHERVGRCLDRLSERERAVLLMTFYEDKQADEVAGLLSLTAGNVRVIRHRALDHLRYCVTGRKAES